jgi:signal transduction histidine kinase
VLPLKEASFAGLSEAAFLSVPENLHSDCSDCPVLALYLARVSDELERLAADWERAEIERALGVKHKLESLVLMAGHMAHDFNNLLMAILGNANLEADQLAADSPGHRFIENIEAAAISAGYANEAKASELVAKYQVGLIYKPFQSAQLFAALGEVTGAVATGG